MPILGELCEELEASRETDGGVHAAFRPAMHISDVDGEYPLSSAWDSESYRDGAVEAAWRLRDWRRDDARHPKGWQNLLYYVRQQRRDLDADHRYVP